jgi:hypothetical protein
VADGNLLYLNGVNVRTGQYLVPPLTIDTALGAMQAEQEPVKGARKYLSFIVRQHTGARLGLPVGVRPENPREAGWAVVFHVAEDAAVKEAVQPLVDHRRERIGDDAIVKVLDYRPGETHVEWLARHGVAAGTVVPQAVPYYVLLVGSPARIPFLFQHLLDVEYAVGRLHFDRVEDYERYVTSIVDYETAPAVANAREAVFFATRHDFDPATRLSADNLVAPLLEGQPDAAFPLTRQPVVDRFQFAARSHVAEEATKAALLKVLKPAGAGPVPSILFTASHGAGVPFAEGGTPADDAAQRAANGALVCQDWPGFGAIGPDHYLTGADLPDDAAVHGMIGFHFACYSAGTPDFDRFAHAGSGAPERTAREPFVAGLPQRLLSHPSGGALACVGHVDRAWGFSIADPRAGVQIDPFRNALWMLMLGWPVGHALKDFSERYAALSTWLASDLEGLALGEVPDKVALACSWSQRNDAEGYVVLGDPAACLRVDDLLPAGAPEGPAA